jgi:hypothetical protein
MCTIEDDVRDRAIEMCVKEIRTCEKTLSRIKKSMGLIKILPIGIPLLVSIGIGDGNYVGAVLEITGYSLNDPDSAIVNVYANETKISRTSLSSNTEYLFRDSLSSISVICTWKVWEETDAPLTVNFALQSAGYKRMAFGS